MVIQRSAATLAALLVLSACSGDPEPKFEPEPTESVPGTSPAVETPEPTPTSVALDPEETVRAWVDAWSASLRSGDTSEVRAYLADPCDGCDGLIEPSETIHESGGVFAGGEWRVDKLNLEDQTAGSVTVNVAVTIAAGSTANSAGAQPSEYPESRHIVKFGLRNESGNWRITMMKALS
jgi:hypothetical protein